MKIKPHDLLALNALVSSPAFCLLYFVYSGIGDAPVFVVILLIANLLVGCFIKIRQPKYYGTIKILEKDSGDMLATLELNGDPLDLINQDEVLFKVEAHRQPREPE